MFAYIVLVLAIAAYGNCCENEYATSVVTDYSSIFGVYEYRYQYTSTESDVPKLNACAKMEFSAPLSEEIEAARKNCASQFEGVKLEVKLSWLESKDKWVFLVSSNDGTRLYNPDMGCILTVAGFEVRRVTRDSILVVSPLDVTKLFMKESASADEYNCIKDKIDVMQGKYGYPVC